MSKVIITIFIIVLILFFGLIFTGKIDVSTSVERGHGFCEKYDMVYEFEKGMRSCVSIEDDVIVETKPIVYIEGAGEWSFSAESTEKENKK